jgi:hypothetical protein
MRMTLLQQLAWIVIIIQFVIALLYVWYRHDFFPVLRLQIQMDWVRDDLLRIHLVVENVSSVVAKLYPKNKPGVHRPKVGIEEKDTTPLQPGKLASEYVPLDREKERDTDLLPFLCYEERIVMTSTETIEPHERISVELLYRLKNKKSGSAIQCVFQVKPKLGVLSTILYAWVEKHRPQFTTTAFAVPGRPTITDNES